MAYRSRHRGARTWRHYTESNAIQPSAAVTSYELIGLAGKSNTIWELKDIVAEVNVSLSPDTSVPYGSMTALVGWMFAESAVTSTGLDIEDTRRFWRPRPIALTRGPYPVSHTFRVRWPRISMSEDEIFRLIWRQEGRPTGSNIVNVSAILHCLQRERQSV